MDKELKKAIIEQMVEYETMAAEVHKRGYFKEQRIEQTRLSVLVQTMVFMEESAALIAQLETLKE